MNIFDILGPIMVGPSSSHTAGAVKIGSLTRLLLDDTPISAVIYLHGSFASTGVGHGTNKALIAGLLGMEPDNIQVPESFQLAEKKGLSFEFHTMSIKDAHPNTALLRVKGSGGRETEVQASSIGGGRIVIDKLDGFSVNFSGDKPTLIVRNTDRPGYVAAVTAMLSDLSVNIGTMHLHRNMRGDFAVMVIETDEAIPLQTIEKLKELDGILNVTYLNKML